MIYKRLITGLLTVLLVNISWISCQDQEEGCTEELNLLADSVSNFTRCAVDQAAPFRFCSLCHQEFDIVRDVKNIIYNKHYGCVKELVESERYQIVKRVYDFAITMWEGSYCYSCFGTNNKEPKNIGGPWVFKKGVISFFDQEDIVKQCFRNYTESASHSITNNTSNVTMTNVTNMHIVCSKCKSYYDDLNNAYYDIINDMGGYIKENVLCADVVSAMNATRQKWSHMFNCVVVDRDTVSVVALTVLFCFCPIVFYTAAKLHGDYTEKKANINIPQINYNSAE